MKYHSFLYDWSFLNHYNYSTSYLFVLSTSTTMSFKLWYNEFLCIRERGLKMKKKMNHFILLLMFVLMAGCTDIEDMSNANEEASQEEVTVDATNENNETKEIVPTVVEEPAEEETPSDTIAEEKPSQPSKEVFPGHKLVEVDACYSSGHREPNVVVDIGFGDRKYWAFTNEHGQLIRVISDKITLQDDNTEHVTSSGRYCSDEAKVPGVESDTLDEGHVIADSLGGVSNAYNITPQDSTLNRHGDQAYMEDAIRKAAGATNFEAIITYPDTKTQVPSSYQYTYTLKGNVIVDKFDNKNPDKVNESLGLTEKKPPKPTNANTKGDISNVDTNGNGQVTIKEAKDAGYSMPITRDHWLYPYMRDNDNDGMVGE